MHKILIGGLLAATTCSAFSMGNDNNEPVIFGIADNPPTCGILIDGDNLAELGIENNEPNDGVIVTVLSNNNQYGSIDVTLHQTNFSTDVLAGTVTIFNSLDSTIMANNNTLQFQEGVTEIVKATTSLSNISLPAGEVRAETVLHINCGNS